MGRGSNPIGTEPLFRAGTVDSRESGTRQVNRSGLIAKRASVRSVFIGGTQATDRVAARAAARGRCDFLRVASFLMTTPYYGAVADDGGDVCEIFWLEVPVGGIQHDQVCGGPGSDSPGVGCSEK
jgi:hypothetical protein